MASHRFPADSFAEVGIPAAGMDTDTVPRLLPPNKAPLLKNFLVDRPGVLTMRGPMPVGFLGGTGNIITGQARQIFSRWIYDDKFLTPTWSTSTTATRDYWVAPYRRTLTSPVLRTYDPTTYLVDPSGSSTAAIAGSAAATAPGIRGVRIGNFVYGPAGDAATTVTQDGYVYKKRAFLRWGGSGSPLVAYVNAPFCGQDVAYHYNRLFVLGGVAVGGTALQHNSLYWSDFLPTDGTSLPDTAAAWQDDVSGLTNQLVAGSDDPNDFGVALAHVGSNLCILKRRSMWMLYGTAPSNWQIKQVSNEVGCIDPRSVVEYNGGVYFMSERGFMFFDGSRVQSTSDGLNTTLNTYAVNHVGPRGADGGFVSAAYLGRGYIAVMTGSSAISGSNIVTTPDSDVWLLHAPTGAWSQFSTALYPSANFQAAVLTPNRRLLFGDLEMPPIDYIFEPELMPIGGRGYDSRDGGTNKFLIPSRWTTRTLELSAPINKSKLQRIHGEYYWNLGNGGWQVTATTRGAAGITTATGTLATPTTVSSSSPARGAVDNFNETDEAYFDIQASATLPPGVGTTFDKAELHRLLVEFESTGRVASSL